jgi:ATP-dependent Lon protease
MTDQALLPLFPLELVLFPGMPLPLHIFEPRYRQLISDCVESRSPFGVVLETGGDRADVGCAADIVEVLNRYPDGRLDILSEGRRRFHILETDTALPYLRGSIQWLDEEDEDVREERDRVIDLYRRTYWAHGQGIPPSELAGTPHPSFVIARSNLLNLGDRQRLLEIPREADRLRALVQVLSRLEPLIRRLSGNGHGSAAR